MSENSYQNKAGINETKSSRSSYASTTVYHWWTSSATIERTRKSHGPQEIQEGTWRWRNTEVRPGGVVKLNYLPRLAALNTS